MAKQEKAPKAQQALTAITSILDKVSDRLTTLSNRVASIEIESGQSRDTIASFNRGFGVYSTDQREKNKKFTESLYALRDSTGKAFDNVTADMKNALTAIQRLSDRVGKLEGQGITIAAIGQRFNTLEARAKYYEEKLDAVHATVQALFAFQEIKGKDSFGEFIYIHPLDLAEIIENKPVNEIAVYSGSAGAQTIVTLGETRYMQSAFIPRRPGKNKIV